LFLEGKEGFEGLYVLAGAMLGPSSSAASRSSLITGLLASGNTALPSRVEDLGVFKVLTW
jgi:hypothetical protein